jgi:hypothetical protein
MLLLKLELETCGAAMAGLSVNLRLSDLDSGSQAENGPAGSVRESVLFIGTRFSNLYTAVDTPAGAA